MSFTPLHKAAKFGNLSKVRVVLGSGRHDVNTADSNKWTPLHWACYGGCVDMVRELISNHHADVNARTIYHCTWQHVVVTMNLF